MRLNADFAQMACIRRDAYEWVPSPAPGVERMMLDRVGDEVARATSLVRYAPNSSFKPHSHGGGEEIFVLSGEFADEHGSYPAGTYIRNPIGTSHSPRIGGQGCEIFVKLHQFAADDSRQFSINTHSGEWVPSDVAGFEFLPLHKHGDEQVALVRWAPNVKYPDHPHSGGEEVFVLEGAFSDAHGTYEAGTWVRYPDGSRHEPTSGDDGALLYLKVGHLTANPPA